MYSIYLLFNTERIVFIQAMQCILYISWHKNCKDMQYFTFLLVINHSKLQPAAQIAAKRRRLARILPQTVRRPRDSQIGWCFFCFIYIYVYIYLFCYRICTFPLVFRHIFYLRWLRFCLFICICICTCVLCVFVLLSYLNFPFCI